MHGQEQLRSSYSSGLGPTEVLRYASCEPGRGGTTPSWLDKRARDLSDTDMKDTKHDPPTIGIPATIAIPGHILKQQTTPGATAKRPKTPASWTVRLQAKSEKRPKRTLEPFSSAILLGGFHVIRKETGPFGKTSSSIRFW